ncbi:MAG: DUF4178 domain-containing protein [Bacteroidota bacterium]
MEYFCPNCGAPLKFRSSVTVYTTCTYCRSMVVRHDMDLESLGEVSELLNDMSPFQVGTRGTFDNSTFTLLGRIKLVYDLGMWSEWYALFDDGRTGWLAEAQGFFMMSFAVVESELPDARIIKVGLPIYLPQGKFIADDIRTVTYAASEGELPFIFKPGFKAVSVDFRNREGQFASILYGPEETQLFVGRYERFDAFSFENLKTIDGWTRA